MMDSDNVSSTKVFRVEHTQTLAVNGQRVTEGVEVSVRVFYEMASSGWVRDMLPNSRSRGTDFMTLIFLALHARPLQGRDLELLVSLGAAAPDDEGKLYARVTDLGLSIETGINRATICASAERLRDYGLIKISDLPPGFRDSKGQFAGSKAYILSGELETMLGKEVTGAADTHRARLTSTVDDSPDTHRARLTSTVDPQNTHRASLTSTVNLAHRASLTSTNIHTYLHEHEHAPPTHLLPHRQPTDLSVRALRNQYPQQPDGLDPNYAFNLALDRAIALLPPKLRQRAEQSLYVLAAELHPVALEQPSRRWPDAGGAGWVVDAVVEAGDRIQSLEYVNKICTRWTAEGNPYAIVPELSDGGDEGFASTFDQAIAATWAAASGTELSNGDLELLAGLLGPGPERTDLGSLLANIVELGRRVERMTPELVEAVVTGRVAMPPLRDTRLPAGGDSASPPVTRTQNLPDDDPVLAQVTRWYNQEISRRITPMVADDLRDLTARQRDPDVWEYAIRASKHISNTKGRWSWVTAVVLQPDMNKINAWLAAGKSPIRPDARTRRSPRGDGRGRSKRAPVVTCAEMPDPPEELMEEPALPPPN